MRRYIFIIINVLILWHINRIFFRRKSNITKKNLKNLEKNTNKNYNQRRKNYQLLDIIYILKKSLPRLKRTIQNSIFDNLPKWLVDYGQE